MIEIRKNYAVVAFFVRRERKKMQLIGRAASRPARPKQKQEWADPATENRFLPSPNLVQAYRCVLRLECRQQQQRQQQLHWSVSLFKHLLFWPRDCFFAIQHNCNFSKLKKSTILTFSVNSRWRLKTDPGCFFLDFNSDADLSFVGHFDSKKRDRRLVPGPKMSKCTLAKEC